MVAAAVEEPAERRWLGSRLAPLLGLAGDMEAKTGTPEQDETFTAWRRFLDAMAAKRPLVVGWRTFGVVLEHGQALLGLGLCAAQLGQAPGRDRLLEAGAIFGQLSARGLLAETDRWLLRATTPGS